MNKCKISFHPVLSLQMLGKKVQGLHDHLVDIPADSWVTHIPPHSPPMLHVRKLGDCQLVTQDLLSQPSFLTGLSISPSRHEQLRTLNTAQQLLLIFPK